MKVLGAILLIADFLLHLRTHRTAILNKSSNNNKISHTFNMFSFLDGAEIQLSKEWGIYSLNKFPGDHTHNEQKKRFACNPKP
jgi:hypothetical protein